MAAPLAAVVAIAAGLAAATGPIPAGDADDRLRALATASGQGDSLLRIGLDPAHHVLISCDRPYRILDAATGSPVWKPSFSGETAVVADGGPERESVGIFRVQVGSFASAERAESERVRLEREMGASGVVRKNLDRGTWRVRLGEARGRDALLPLLQKVRAAGFDSAWISEEPTEVRQGVTLRLVDASYESRSTAGARLAVIPDAGARVRVEGKPYRGVIEIRVSPSGMVRAIDWVGLEPYLLGVVPSELGPEVWPRLEALKAQAVAARTYAWRNRGQFEEEGFDLCATPRCQVYGGAAAEHPLSDRAVAETRGEILTWNGKPINALYTATCGGHTEDAAEVFPEEAAPYLVGVACRAEDGASATLKVRLEGARVREAIAENGDDVTRDWALLSVTGVLDPGGRGSDPLARAGAAEVREWARGVASLAGLREPAAHVGEVRTLSAAVAELVAAVGWEPRASVLLAREDLDPLLRDPEAATLPERERRALAYLAWVGALRPFPDGGFHPSDPPTAARLVPLLARIGDAYDAFGLREAVVAGGADRLIRLAQGKGDLTLPVSRTASLFALSGGRAVPAPRLDLWPGDRVRFRTGPDGTVDFLEVKGPVKGASDDRLASVYSWEVRRTREEVEEAIDRKLAVGRLQDLEVVRRGKSGRIVELKVVGAAGTATVRGFDIRGLLDLRENLAVVEPQRDRRGDLEAVVFAGKGWGHGVGLCQVGAYGMALRGSGYREILSHYYRGAKLERIAASGANDP
jgi:stage II sporulation protein D